jgi:hypothetical protein
MRPTVHGGFPFDEARKVDGWAFVSSFRLSCLTSGVPRSPLLAVCPRGHLVRQDTNLSQPLPWLCRMVVRGRAGSLHHSNRLGRNWPVMSPTRKEVGAWRHRRRRTGAISLAYGLYTTGQPVPSSPLLGSFGRITQFGSNPVRLALSGCYLVNEPAKFCRLCCKQEWPQFDRVRP